MATSKERLVPQLVETTGPYAGRVHEVGFGEHIIGRGGDVSIRLDDKDVSRRHARVVVGPDGITIEDLGSKNGVYAGGRMISTVVKLSHGDSFSFGDLTLTVSHPASQVKSALNLAGETTMTTTRTAEDDAPAGVSLVWPLLGVLLFGGLVAAMVLM